MKYRKKPVVVEAVKVIHSEMISTGPEHSPFAEIPDWLKEAVEAGTVRLTNVNARDYAVLEINTGHGWAEAGPGDFIVRGVKGELYPCEGEIFAATYDRVPDPIPDDPKRCAVCGWTMAATVHDGCVAGNCSMRPRPDHLYAPERAAAEAAR